MDETTRAAALELNAAGMTQREAAAALGLSRASYRRAIGAASVNARANGSRPAGPVRTSRNRAESLDALGIVPEDMEGLTADDLEGEDDTAEDDTAEDEWSTRKALTVLATVAVLGLVAWLVYRRRVLDASSIQFAAAVD